MARDWKSYNEALIKRGEILLSLDFIDNYDKELEELNKHKVGRLDLELLEKIEKIAF